MTEEVAERTKENRAEQTNDNNIPYNVSLDYKKDLFRIEIIHKFLEMFKNDEKSVHRLEAFLSQFTLDDEKRLACEILNSMAENKIILFTLKENLYNKKILVDDNDGNIQFKLSSQPYNFFGFVIDEIYSEKKVLIESHKENREYIDEKISVIEMYENDILKVRADSKGILKEIKELKSSIINQVDEIKTKFMIEVKKETTEELANATENVKAIASDTANNIIENELSREGKIGKLLDSIQKDIIQYMAIFIAIFALLNLNLSNLSSRSMKDFITLNLSLIASLATLIAILALVLYRPKTIVGKSCWVGIMSVFSIILWIIIIHVCI